MGFGKHILKFVIGCLLFGYLSIARAQTGQLNSLKQELAQTTDKGKQKALLFKICNRQFSLAPDSLLKYIQFGESIIPNGSQDWVELETFQITYLSKKGQSEAAILLAEQLYRQAIQMKANTSILLKINIEKCRAYIRNNQNKEAIALSFKLLQDSEKSKDTGTIILSFTLLGWANMELEKYNEAVKWLDKGTRYTNNTQYFTQNPALFVNLASCYNNLNQLQNALEQVESGLKYAIKSENLTIQANAFNVRADISIKQKKINAAQKDLEEALYVRELLGDPYYVLSDMGQLAFFYASNGETHKGIELAQKGIAIAESGKQLPKIIYLYAALAENYKMSKQSDKLAATLLTILALKDSLYQNNSAKAIADLEGKYEYQKKENTILQQHYALSQNRYVTYGLGALLLISIFLFISLYKNYQHIQKRKLASMLNEQKQISEVAIHSAEEKERKRIAADLHDNLGAHAAAISSGVKYFKEGLYNQNEIISQLDENASWIVNHLNDTIWVLKNEKLHFTNLTDRFKLWLQRILVNYPNIRYNFIENITFNMELTPNKILHLFMMLKESVNNAIKHSDCNELTIHFVCNQDRFEIIIEDNGKGIHQKKNGSGNGLENLKQRAAECGWQIEWQQRIPNGTNVLLSGTTIN